MKHALKQRLEVLKSEFAAGEQRQAALQREQLALHETLLRISGAIQVLEELLAESEAKPEAEVLPLERR
jgi:predicted nuclease with TOPRIM domain